LRTRRSARIDVDRILGALPSLFSGDRGVDRPPFASPEQAMRWFEWRRQSRLLPLIVFVTSMVLAFFILNIVHDIGFEPSTRAAMLAGYGETVAVAFYFGLLAGAVGFGAYCFFQNQRLQLSPLKSFLFTRPVSTKQLGQARIVVVLRSVVISMVPFLLVGAVAILLVIGNTEPTVFRSRLIVNENMDLGGVGITLCCLFGFAAIIWCYQWVGNLLALLSVLGIGSLIGLILVFIVDVEVSREEAFITACAFWLTACVSVAAGAYAFYQAFQRDLVEKKSMYIALATWPLLVAGFAVLLNPDQYFRGGGFSELSLNHVGVILACAVLPIAPLATVPLVMQYARHR
jgi:hypothetical protein